jgi:hypothetical protein
VGSALLRQILFPVKFIDSAFKDIINYGDDKGVEMLSSIPVVGKLAYWHFGRGVSKREDLWDRRLRKEKAKLGKVKERFEQSKDKEAFRAKHQEELTRLNRVNNLQGRLNSKRKRINKLKSRPDTPENRKTIRRLEEERTETIKTFLKR